jgi:uncharacterized DUF497 family protein
MIVVGQLKWNPRNIAHIAHIAHIARHGVSVPEVEEACRGHYISRPSRDGRYLLVGTASSGRVLTVIVEFEQDGSTFVVTARPASRTERRQLSLSIGRDEDERQ